METEYFWLIAGVVLVILEFMAPAVGFLFAGLAALIVGVLMSADVITTTAWQWIVFLGFTTVFAAVLWKPLKNFRSSKNAQSYNDMVGHKAILVDDLAHGHVGQAKWSGTTMKAKLDDSVKHAKAGQTVEIVSVQGNILIVK